jgi:hypothetical protein
MQITVGRDQNGKDKVWNRTDNFPQVLKDVLMTENRGNGRKTMFSKAIAESWLEKRCDPLVKRYKLILSTFYWEYLHKLNKIFIELLFLKTLEG